MAATTVSPRQRAAEFYVSALGWSLCRIPLGLKGPREDGWNQPPMLLRTVEAVREAFARHGDINIGLVHGWSGTCAVDIDNVEAWEVLAKAMGLPSLDVLFDGAPRILTREGKDKAIFRLPEGAEGARHVLRWIDNDGKNFTVFELRGGFNQDVLPPSIHPDTNQPYRWIKEPKHPREIPDLPPVFAMLWRSWKALEPTLKGHDPNAKQAPPALVSKERTENADLVGAFNRDNPLRHTLEKYGYVPEGDRYLSPTSTSGVAGIVVFEADDDGVEHFYSHGGSDFFSDAKRHDAFDLFVRFEHGGDFAAGVRAAASRYGGREAADVFSALGDSPATDSDPFGFGTLEGNVEVTLPRNVVVTNGIESLLTSSAHYSYLIDQFIPAEKTLSSLWGRGGAGKSKLALSLACCIAAGRNALGHPALPIPEVGRTVFVDIAENNPNTFKIRMQANLTKLVDEGLPAESRELVARRITHVFVDELLYALAFEGQYGATMHNEPRVKQMRSILTRIRDESDEPVVWVVFDSLYKLHTLSENSSTHMLFLMQTLHDLVTEVFGGIARTFIHHSRKGDSSDTGSSMRGSGSLEAAVRTSIGIQMATDAEMKLLEQPFSLQRKFARVFVEKTNYPTITPNEFFVHDHGGAWWHYNPDFEAEDRDYTKTTGPLTEDEYALFITLVRQDLDSGIGVSGNALAQRADWYSVRIGRPRHSPLTKNDMRDLFNTTLARGLVVIDREKSSGNRVVYRWNELRKPPDPKRDEFGFR